MATIDEIKSILERYNNAKTKFTETGNGMFILSKVEADIADHCIDYISFLLAELDALQTALGKLEVKGEGE